MDNNIVESAANKIDKQKKRSKLIKMLKEVPEATTPEKSKRSFWKNLFKFRNKQDHSEAQAHRLNTIYEETQLVDEKNTEMELEQIKNTLRDIAQNSNPSTILNGLIGHKMDVAKDDLLHEDLAGYLTDDSSEQDEEENEEEGKTTVQTNNPPESQINNTKTSTEQEAEKPVIKEDGKKVSEEKLNVKDAYSFEYSEKSGNSEEVAEDKPDKVKFDDKVVSKDVDNNIVVTPLNETESKTQELENELLKASEENEATEEQLAAKLKKTNLSLEQNEDTSATTDEAAKPDSEDARCNGPSENWSQYEENSNKSTPSSFHKLEATDSSEICEEYVIWSKKLNDLSDIAPKSAVPTLNTKTEIKIQEPRYENNFTTVSGNTISYSIAYDPFFNDFTKKQLEEHSKIYVDDKQKVIRKRKMMSLLHDKQIFKDYMKEIEENDTQHNKESNNCDAPMDSPLIKLFANSPKTNNLSSKDTDPSENQSEISTNEGTLSVLEETKNKLTKLIQNDSVLDSKIQSLYPNNYLEKFNLENKIPLENVSNNNSFCQTEISSIDSDQLSVVSHERIHTSEALLSQVRSLSSKMITSEDVNEKMQVNHEMQILIDELMLNISELQDTCIQIGTAISDHASNPLVSFRPIGDSEAVVSPIIEEIFNTLFEVHLKQKPEYGNQKVEKVKLDCPSVNSDNIPYNSSLKPSTSLNFKLTPMVKSSNRTPLNSTLKTNLDHATGLLSAIYDEMCQFNPIPNSSSKKSILIESFDLDDSSIESLDSIIDNNTVPSDDIELPIAVNMINDQKNSHFNFDRFSYRQPNDKKTPSIENLSDDEKILQFNVSIKSSKADDKIIRNSNNTLELSQTANMSSKNFSDSEEKLKTQKILNEASKIPLPVSDDDDELDDELENDKKIDKIAMDKRKSSSTNEMLMNVSKLPLASNYIQEKKILKTKEISSLINMILDEASKIPLPLSDEEAEEVDNDKHQEKEINKCLFKKKKSVSLTNMILDEASKRPLPLSDDDEAVDTDKDQEKEGSKLFINEIDKQVFKKEKTVSLTNMILDEVSKICLALSHNEEEIENDKHQEKEDKKLLLNNINDDERLSLLNTTKHKSKNIAITSTYESQPGTSKQEHSLIKPKKSNTIILPRLPSVPSIEITCVSLEADNTIRTLLKNNLSSSSSVLISNSSQSKEINLYNFSYVSDGSFDAGCNPLEKKTSTVNLATRMNDSKIMNDCLTDSELEMYIKTNIRDFEESIQRTIDYNKTTLEMMNSSKLGSPEGSLTILSTISANMLPELAVKQNPITDLQLSTHQSFENIIIESDDFENNEITAKVQSDKNFNKQ